MMKVCILFLSMMFLLAPAGKAHPKIWDETEQEKQERMAWWTHDRFGMFIHWGLYALPARHEWVMRYWKIMKSISTCSSRICIIRVSGPRWRRLRV